MRDLRRINAFAGYRVEAIDGRVGKVRECYFDDVTWLVRHLVVDSGTWFFGKRLLLHPTKVGLVDHGRRSVFVPTSKAKVLESPSADSDRPVALQHEARSHRHYYGWEIYLGAEVLFGYVNPLDLEPRVLRNAGGRPFDPHLRSTRVLTGYYVQDDGGSIARVTDLLVTDAWAIRHLVVRPVGRPEVLLPTQFVSRIDCPLSRVYADVSAKTLWGCPPLAPGEEVREHYLGRVDEHFGLLCPTSVAAG